MQVVRSLLLLLAAGVAARLAEARPEEFGRWFVVPSTDGAGSYAGECGPSVRAETPACNVSGRSKGHELRSYPDDELWVTTIVMNASYDKALEDGVWRCRSFFQSHNSKAHLIPTTAPVLTVPRPEASGYEVSFLVPRRYSAETVPQPLDPTVRLVKMPPGTVRAALGPFGGFPTEGVFEGKLLRLKQMLDARGMAYDDSTGAYATYSSPYTLLNRKHEVWIRVFLPS